MKYLRPKTTILIGFLLVLLGAVIPWLIILRVIPSTFFLNFFAYAVSISGLFLGIIGVAFYTRDRPRKE